MKRRFILYRRKSGGVFYLEDTQTRKQESPGTRDHTEAMTLLLARNESVRQPQLLTREAMGEIKMKDRDHPLWEIHQEIDTYVDSARQPEAARPNPNQANGKSHQEQQEQRIASAKRLKIRGRE